MKSKALAIGVRTRISYCALAIITIILSVGENTMAQTKSALIGAILHEREVELFTELGHRFFDLKRNGLANSVLGAYKSTWKRDTSLVLPIPQNDITRDPNLKQNKGY